jgi:hypothetical protein
MKEKQSETSSPNTRFRKLGIDEENEGSKWYVEFNRLLHSRKCIIAYIILIIISVFVFCYSIASYFLSLGKKILFLETFPIILFESILISVIAFDVIIRVYVCV